ncbi:MAG TPA: 4-hydroxyphenylpyruvate dioxygenase [Pirellulaceae bacterium]|nr:4-hydroxyphenylpyruvate dioxygenase [Pirellulaceae bacterium]
MTQTRKAGAQSVKRTGESAKRDRPAEFTDYKLGHGGSRVKDPLRLIDVDHVHLFVGNAKQAAFFYAYCFGFEIEQVSDLTTGNRESASYLLTQGNIRLLLTSGLSGDHLASREVARFGDGVKDVAFTVENAEAAYEKALANGAQSAYEPRERTDAHGTVVTAGIQTFGRVVHSFVSRTGEYALEWLKKQGPFAPSFQTTPPLEINQYNRANPCGLFYVDHCVGNVELGQMNRWVSWYEDVLQFKLFKHFDDKDISTEYSALMSKVMDSGRELIKIPINEPAEGRKKSQIQEFLDWHDQTPGIQHLALLTSDAIDSVAQLRKRGVDFLSIPDSYYESVWDRVGDIREDARRVEELRLLADRDDQGYLLQIFTKPLQDRPTLFFEIICRRGSQSFGKGNFKALFESLEIEQERRGNL